jgi:hypothetical protein
MRQLNTIFDLNTHVTMVTKISKEQLLKRITTKDHGLTETKTQFVPFEAFAFLFCLFMKEKSPFYSPHLSTLST